MIRLAVRVDDVDVDVGMRTRMGVRQERGMLVNKASQMGVHDRRGRNGTAKARDAARNQDVQSSRSSNNAVGTALARAVLIRDLNVLDAGLNGGGSKAEDDREDGIHLSGLD